MFPDDNVSTMRIKMRREGMEWMRVTYSNDGKEDKRAFPVHFWYVLLILDQVTIQRGDVFYKCSYLWQAITRVKGEACYTWVHVTCQLILLSHLILAKMI